MLARLPTARIASTSCCGRSTASRAGCSSATLRQLERDGLVQRHVYARVPARVEYELSPVGEDLLVALAPLAGWGLEHQADVSSAREHYDRLQLWRTAGRGDQGPLADRAANRLAVVASQRTVIGVPTGIALPSRRMSRLRSRMHPCDTRPGTRSGRLVP